jgi:hypothetical protein
MHTHTHSSLASVLLNCSAVNSSSAPASPILFQKRLHIHNCKHGAWRCRQNHPHHIIVHIQPHWSDFSVVLTCSAAPRSRAPASPMLLRSRLPGMCK